MAQNTISDELNRLIQAKTNIRKALQEKCGLTIGDSSTLDEFPALIEDMPSGGGSGVDTSVLIDLIEDDLENLVIPEGTTKIRDYAFQNSSSLTNVTIPNTVIEIGQNAFAGCIKLDNVICSNSITSIPLKCFKDATKLANFIIPNNVTFIGGNAFDNCKNLSNLIVPSSVNLIDSFAFSGCTKLRIVFLHNTSRPGKISTAFNNTSSGPIYVLNSMVDTFKLWNDVSNRITPLASATFESSTNTVQASGRDTLELYIDSSLINSSVYTFTPGAEDASHNITVKSVDPSLGVLDTYNLEVLVEGLSIPSTTPVIVLDPEVSQEEVDILDENDEPTGETETQEIPTGMYRVIATANSDTQYVSITVNGVDASNPTDYVYEAADGWDTPDSSLDATLVVTATCQEPGKTPTTVTEYYIEAESGGEDPGGDETYDYTLTPEFVEDTYDGTEYSGYLIQRQTIEAPNNNYNNGDVAGIYDLNNLSQNGDYAIVSGIIIYPPYNAGGGDDAGVITPVRITLYEAPSGTMTVTNNYSTIGTLTQDQNNPLVYTYTVTNDQRAQESNIQCISNNAPILFKVAQVDFNYTQYE